MLHDIKSGSATGCRDDGLARSRVIRPLGGPILSVLQDPRFGGAHSAGEGLTEGPSRILVHRKEAANLIITEAVDMELFNVVTGIVYHELADVVVPERERKAAGARGPGR